MFLNPDNKIKWKKLIVASGVTLALVLCGIFWFDAPVLVWLNWFNHFVMVWGLTFLLQVIFDVKIWLALSVFFVLAFYVKKTLQTDSRFCFSDFVAKIKNSYAFMVFCSVFCAVLAGGLLKVIIGRARPIFYMALGMRGFYPFSLNWEFQSMPSGHTLASFAGLVMIGLLAPRAKWFTWTLATIIGVSRVVAGMHWPSDVILGAFIGMVAADIVKSVMARRMK